MSGEIAGIVQYANNCRDNTNGGFIKAIFFELLSNKPVFDQINWYMKNFEKQPLQYNLFEGKNEKLAKENRETGNRCFTENNFMAALSKYNTAIAYGKNSENLSICFANRSAVYFELGMFEKCLENIQKAKELKYPKRLTEKLDKRASDAKRGLLKSEIIPNMRFDCLSKLTKPVSDLQPFLVNCLEGIELDDLKKRKIRTKYDLEVGDIISMESKPLTKLLKRKLIFSHCTFCLSTNAAMSMIPCKFCSTAMFCNEECYKQANELFHQIECPMIDAIYGMLSDSMWLGLRTILIAVKMCGSVKKYEEFLLSKKEENIFEQQFSSSEMDICASFLERYMALLNLPQSQEFSLDECVGTAFALKLLKENTKLIGDGNVERFLAIAIYDSMKIARDNSMLLEEMYTLIGLNNEITFYGTALYPFACNFNLSCAPNMLLLNEKNAMLGVIIRPIKSGGVLYAGLPALNHITGDRSYRQNLKKLHLGKICECIACASNYGRMENLRVVRNVDQPTVPQSLATLAFLDRKGGAILKQYKFLCDYLNRHAHLDYLSFQMAGAINQLIFTLSKMAHPPAIEMKMGESLGSIILHELMWTHKLGTDHLMDRFINNFFCEV